MNTLLIHPQTDVRIKTYLKKPTHALILSGEEGSGKTYLTHHLADELSLPILTVESEEGKSTITIDQIRALYGLTRTGNPLLVHIKDAHQLGTEAQNAFLKLLEEPPAEVKFILTANKTDAILPTIRSRSQEIKVAAPKKNDLLTFAQNEYLVPPQELASLLYVTKNLPGKLIAQLDDSTLRARKQEAIDEAKRFYASTPYQRHGICIEHKYDKEWAADLLDTLGLIVRSLLRASKTPSQIGKLRKQASLIELTAKHTLQINGNPKIHLAKLCQQL